MDSVRLQIEYSLLERTVERELLPMAKDQQMTVLAWSPLRNGMLTGKYLPENVKQSEAEGTRMHTEMMKAFGEIVAVGQELGVSPAQVALAWLRYRSGHYLGNTPTRRKKSYEAFLAKLHTKT